MKTIAATSQRGLLIAGSVLLLHAGALVALQSGLMHRVVATVMPAEVIAELIEPPRPAVAPPPPEPAKPRVSHKAAPLPLPVPAPMTRPVPAPERPAPAAAPVADLPASSERSADVVQAPAHPAPATAAPAAIVAAPPAPPVVTPPSSDAAYLQNPAPAYPAMSRRLREQGKVVVDVLIGADGSAQQARLKHSSGYDRLDQAALETVQRWRYVPGRKGGVAMAMWFSVPINFVLE